MRTIYDINSYLHCKTLMITISYLATTLIKSLMRVKKPRRRRQIAKLNRYSTLFYINRNEQSRGDT